MPELDLDTECLALVRRILSEHGPGLEVWAHGSRVTGTARRWSDLDLLLVSAERADPKALDALREAFATSDLPIRVDLAELRSLPPSLAALTRERHVVLQTVEVANARS